MGQDRAHLILSLFAPSAELNSIRSHRLEKRGPTIRPRFAVRVSTNYWTHTTTATRHQYLATLSKEWLTMPSAGTLGDDCHGEQPTEPAAIRRRQKEPKRNVSRSRNAHTPRTTSRSLKGSQSSWAARYHARRIIDAPPTTTQPNQRQSNRVEKTGPGLPHVNATTNTGRLNSKRDYFYSDPARLTNENTHSHTTAWP